MHPAARVSRRRAWSGCCRTGNSYPWRVVEFCHFGGGDLDGAGLTVIVEGVDGVVLALALDAAMLPMREFMYG